MMEDEEGILNLFPVPTPTGITHIWLVDASLIPVIEAIKDGLFVAMQRQDTESYGCLVDQLVSLPGHPATCEGDSIEIRVRPPLIISYNRDTFSSRRD